MLISHFLNAANCQFFNFPIYKMEKSLVPPLGPGTVDKCGTPSQPTTNHRTDCYYLVHPEERSPDILEDREVTGRS